MMDLCEMYNLQNLIKEPTCYKNANNPSSIVYLQIVKVAFKIQWPEKLDYQIHFIYFLF